MAVTNSFIRPIDIVFTSTETSIAKGHNFLPETKLRIQLIPTTSGQDIAKIILSYSDPPLRISECLSDEALFRSIVYYMKGSSGTLVSRLTEYMQSLSDDEVSVIIKEYTKYIDKGTILDGFIAGVAAYLGFVYLNENSLFANQMIFQFGLPCAVVTGNTLNRNMFQHLSLPLTALVRMSQGIILQLTLFVQGFINMWEPAFEPGPIIGPNSEARMCIEVIAGVSNSAIASLAKIKSQQEDIVTSVQNVEARLKSALDRSLSGVKQEVNKLLARARSPIDDAITAGISQRMKEELDTAISNKIAREIERARARIKEMIREHVLEEGMKSVSNLIQTDEGDLRGAIIGLEHRIEILYNRLNSISIQKISDDADNEQSLRSSYISAISSSDHTNRSHAGPTSDPDSSSYHNRNHNPQSPTPPDTRFKESEPDDSEADEFSSNQSTETTNGGSTEPSDSEREHSEREHSEREYSEREHSEREHSDRESSEHTDNDLSDNEALSASDVHSEGPSDVGGSLARKITSFDRCGPPIPRNSAINGNQRANIQSRPHAPYPQTRRIPIHLQYRNPQPKRAGAQN